MRRSTVDVVLGGVVLAAAAFLTFGAPEPVLAREPEPEGCSACTTDCQYVMVQCINQCTSIVPFDDCKYSIFPCLGFPGHFRVTCDW